MSIVTAHKGYVFTPVCQSILFQRGGCLPQCMLAYTPPGQTPPWADTPQGSRHPPSPGEDTPPAAVAYTERLRANKAGGTHPNGMHTCIY